MKLTIKHLAPYLPYGLKCYVDEYGIELIIGATNDEVITTEDSSAIDSIKPILRPLSDLTNEIEVNGEKFVPVEKLYDGTIKVWENDKETHGIFYDYIMELHEHDLLDELTYAQVFMLIEWLFDCFGLIEKGLAIDINTIKK